MRVPEDHGSLSVRFVIGWDDARNKGDEVLVFGDGVPMDGLSVRSVADFMTCVHHRQHVGDALRDTYVPSGRAHASLCEPPLRIVTDFSHGDWGLDSKFNARH